MTNAGIPSPRPSFVEFKWDSRSGPVLMISIGNKKLGLTLICHRKPERCLTFFGHKSFLCSRCTGISLGTLAFFALWFLHISIPLVLGTALALPMVVDGFSQILGLRQSNNSMRLVTGLLFSVGFLSLLVK